MPEGITVLTESIGMPAQFVILIFLSIIMMIGAGLILGGSISEMKDDGVTVGNFIWCIVALIVIVGLIIGIIAMATTQEHTYKIMLSDTYPANKLYEQFEVRNVDGLIYTILEKNPAGG